MNCWRAAAALLMALTMCAFGQETSKKVSRSEALENAVSKVQPDYPPMAKQLRIAGEVELEAVVAENGTVDKVNIVSGNPVLTKPASEALKKWKFKPFVADGKPIRVLAPVNMNFKRE